MTKHLSALLLALAATPALAAEPLTPATSIVRTADLDLASKTGQRTLDRRLSIAIVEVCGTASDADLVGQNEVRRCRVTTRQRVSSEVELRTVSASIGPIVIAAR